MTNLRFTILTLCLVCLSSVAIAQFTGKEGKKPGTKGEAPQWQLGIKGGVNLGHVEATKSYSVVTPLDLSSSLTNGKVYDKAYSNMGNHIGLTGSVALSPNFSLGFEPGYATYKFGYETSYEWSQFENLQAFVNVDNDIDHVVSYLDLPITIKYHLKTGALKPFVQLGGYYSFRTNADKEVTTVVEDGAAGGLGELSSNTQRVGVDDLFIRSSAGLVGGAGVSLDVGSSPSGMGGSSDLGTVRFVFGVNYRYGLHNIVDVQNRFDDSYLTSGAYDVTDDIELRNIEIYLGCQFTLKYKDY